MVKNFRLLVESHGGTLLCALNAQPPTIVADELHITNMVYNLIDNAIKYSPEKIDIQVSTRTEGSNTILSVADHGLGISQEDQKHIFERFYRVSTGNVHNVKGFGIGLNYVYQVVQLHRGTVTIDSTPGEGSTFTITLPQE